MHLTRITETVYQVTLPIVNVFLVDLPSGLLLIDTGPKGSRDLIFEAIRQIGKQPEDLKFIIITHAHHDHAGGLASILETVKAQVYASPLCADKLQRGIAFEPESDFFRFLLRFVTGFGLMRLPFVYIAPIISPIKTVSEGEIIPDESGLQVINAPGHTAEQIALFYPVKEALLFAADVAENLNKLKPAFAYQSSVKNRQTLQKLAAFDFEVAAFGHGTAVTKQKFHNLLT